MKHLSWIVAIALLIANSLQAAQAAPDLQLTAQDRQAIADFDQRVKQYMSMRTGANKGDSKQRETKDAAKIADARASLVTKIRSARAAAKPGDIFTPHIQQHFRKFLAPEMIGTKGQNTKGSIKDEAPAAGTVKLEVNGEYPKDQPLGSVPPNVLKALPELPEGLEYRFVDRHLTLRDAEANLIIDFMPAAIPAK